MKKISCFFIFVVLCFSVTNVYAFKSGPVLNIVADVGGSTTMPSISDEDLAYLGANKMDGMTGFVAGGYAEGGYIFGVEEFFNFESDDKFSGVGVFGYIGVGEGYAGQISGSEINGEQVDVYFNVHYSPVIAAGISGKAYFFKNRLAVGLQTGITVIADTQPVYEMYASDVFDSEVGTIIVEDWMMTKMNAISFNFKALIEYNIPILDTLEVVLGGYIGGNIYSPKYITMPPTLLESAIQNAAAEGREFDQQTPLTSYYINSLEYGLKIGLGLAL